MLNPAKRQELLKDLTLQTGINIEMIKLKRIDIGKSNAEILAYFRKETPVKETSDVQNKIVGVE